MGCRPDSRGKWSQNLSKALHAAVDRGGRIKFEVTELKKQNQMTANELRLIRADPKLLAHTDFYEMDEAGHYRKLDDKERDAAWKRVD